MRKNLRSRLTFDHASSQRGKRIIRLRQLTFISNSFAFRVHRGNTVGTISLIPRGIIAIPPHSSPC